MPRSRTRHQLTEKGAAIVALLQERGPMLYVDIRSHFGWSDHTMTRHLQFAKKLKAIAGMTSGARGGYLWFILRHRKRADVIRAANKREQARRKAAREVRRLARIAAERDAAFEAAPVRRAVPAASAPSIVLRAPISVFHLGAML